MASILSPKSQNGSILGMMTHNLSLPANNTQIQSISYLSNSASQWQQHATAQSPSHCNPSSGHAMMPLNLLLPPFRNIPASLLQSSAPHAAASQSQALLLSPPSQTCFPSPAHHSSAAGPFSFAAFDSAMRQGPVPATVLSVLAQQSPFSGFPPAANYSSSYPTHSAAAAAWPGPASNFPSASPSHLSSTVAWGGGNSGPVGPQAAAGRPPGFSGPGGLPPQQHPHGGAYGY